MNIQLLVILFAVGFCSDLFLQTLSQYNKKVNLFRPFWNSNGIFGSATIAGLITLIIGGLMIMLSSLIFSLMNVNTKSQQTLLFILFATTLAFVLGIVVDIYTNRNNLLGPTLRKWYDTMGQSKAALLTGGMTFAFTVFISLTANKMLNKKGN